jgi:hypothetical protein
LLLRLWRPSPRSFFPAPFLMCTFPPTLLRSSPLAPHACILFPLPHAASSPPSPPLPSPPARLSRSVYPVLPPLPLPLPFFSPAPLPPPLTPLPSLFAPPLVSYPHPLPVPFAACRFFFLTVLSFPPPLSSLGYRDDDDEPEYKAARTGEHH